jgi:hypothetical protein
LKKLELGKKLGLVSDLRGRKEGKEIIPTYLASNEKLKTRMTHASFKMSKIEDFLGECGFWERNREKEKRQETEDHRDRERE